MYDNVSDTWTTRAAMPIAQTYYAIGLIGQSVYVFGGLDSNGNYIAVTQAYDIASNTWSAKASMPTPRFGAAAEVVNGQIYVIGGTQGIPGTNTNTGLAVNEVYDPVLNRWQSNPAMPTARYQHSIVVVNNNIYVVGGNNGGTALTTNEMYTPGRVYYVHQKN